MKKICVFTGTRAEYGILLPLLKALRAEPAVKLQLLVSGTHLLVEFGETYQAIEADGFEISEKVDMLLASDSGVGMAKSTGLGFISYTDSFDRLKPDYVVILGDRFEAFAAAGAAFMSGIPVIHISGGDSTEGALDDAFRHSITKMSYLHFVTTEAYKNRVIQLGESPEMVHNFGSLSIDNIKSIALQSLEELETSVGFKLTDKFFLVTYHPETLGDGDVETLLGDFLKALDVFMDYKILITLPNADANGRKMIGIFKEYERNQPERVKVVASLGQLRYLSAIRHAAAVIGNSSSGIIEVPSFQVPTVNIGDRQKGRLGAESIIHTDSSFEAVVEGIRLAVSDEYKEKFREVKNIYGDGNAAEQMMKVIMDLPEKVSLRKKFYDLK